jgi:hypothetical protein
MLCNSFIIENGEDVSLLKTESKTQVVYRAFTKRWFRILGRNKDKLVQEIFKAYGRRRGKDILLGTGTQEQAESKLKYFLKSKKKLPRRLTLILMIRFQK